MTQIPIIPKGTFTNLTYYSKQTQNIHTQTNKKYLKRTERDLQWFFFSNVKFSRELRK